MRTAVNFFLTGLLFLSLVASQDVHATRVQGTLCIAHYSDATSISFGRLYKEAEDIETVESLNDLSKELIFRENPDPIEHMINTLLYYRALSRFLDKRKLEEDFELATYRSIYVGVLKEVRHRNAKFNFFKSYLREPSAKPLVAQ